MNALQNALYRSWLRATHPERGDVPGWVMITLMTAGLVAVLMVVARNQFLAMFQQAISQVTGG